MSKISCDGVASMISKVPSLLNILYGPDNKYDNSAFFPFGLSLFIICMLYHNTKHDKDGSQYYSESCHSP